MPSRPSREHAPHDPLRSLGLVLFAVIYVGSGIAHFVATPAYESIMPPYLPHPHALVLWSGAFEVLGGVGILYRSARKFAAWGVIALLLAVFPANLHMAMSHVGYAGPVWVLWARLPLQIPLILWAFYYTRH